MFFISKLFFLRWYLFIFQEFVNEKGYPFCTQVARILEGAEPSAFKKYFSSWDTENGEGREFQEYF